ncbi:UDP-N-acetylmuramoyl-tripeptide--D-alanyl-D-alanine ligase [Lentibacter algarum]|uniref:UDP-N-acetylmuramoyl-tripeptide--D-alanyl-D- alanine ligase n=1 Tax=Lentibacter algarum TaxID=576131 RepID=UPI001C08F32E|nr:UDP-N-acetylmuramoyl-tripeptide--D-alanyl-D-alanine ligase [Lentibacter algarum]MBU2983249.1 UDP-N-acetylmuramoyl-tripeptide--D-alanyl-D-alanine ligase [Lentibacter algarum]
MTPLWTSAEAAAATGGVVRSDWAALGVSIDTRTLVAGDLFVALRAARDGHEFVASALEKGAAAALVSHVPQGLEGSDKLLLVDDVQAALEALGKAGRARTTAKIIGVTGSAGKTSTKEMLREILVRQGFCHAAEASYNNHWGVPLTLARMPRETDFAVIEIGMSNPGEIGPLAQMARPHVALITTVAAAHMAAFESLDGIAREKAAILEGLEAGGVAVWNADISTAHVLAEAAADCGAKSVDYGVKASNYRLLSTKLHGDITVAEAEVNGAHLVFKVGAAGQHFAMNGLGAIAACEAIGIDCAIAAADLAYWQPPAGRGKREILRLDEVEDDVIELIDDAFNANPASMAASLQVLADIPQEKGRKLAVLGDMLELGQDAVKLHAEVAELPSIEAIDQVHCVGPLMKNTWDALPADKQGEWFETADDLAHNVRHYLFAGDIILVKGSKGIAVSKVVTAIRDAVRSKARRNGQITRDE